MNSIVLDMLAKHGKTASTHPELAFREVAQEILLSALAQTDFFNRAAFYGGTCLRIFYGLDRFSEDLDFGITSDDPSFSLADYLPAIDKMFSALGIQMTASIHHKTATTNVESASADGPARDILIELFPENADVVKTVFNQKIRIKFEVAVAYVPGASYEYKTLLLPFYSRVRCFNQESLFAGKLAAVLARNWKYRTKGRDFYDFAFYVARGAKVNFEYLTNQLVHDGYLEAGAKLDMPTLKTLLEERIRRLDVESAKQDASAFAVDLTPLSYWSTEYFLDVVDALK